MRGIYTITNILTGTVYYGQSENISKRFIRHCCDLNKNIHDNNHLQRAWNKYGKENFEFKLTELIEDSTIDLTPIEQRYYESTINKYNEVPPIQPLLWTLEKRNKKAESMKGDKNHFFGKIHSLEAKKKNSESHKGKNIGNKYAQYKHSKEQNKKHSIRMKLWWNNRKAAKGIE